MFSDHPLHASWSEISWFWISWSSLKASAIFSLSWSKTDFTNWNDHLVQSVDQRGFRVLCHKVQGRNIWERKMSYGRPPPRIDGMVSLKVDNLTYRTTPEDLRRVFERCGEVGDIYIPRDRFTRESRGFAFVRWVSLRRDAIAYRERHARARPLFKMLNCSLVGDISDVSPMVTSWRERASSQFSIFASGPLLQYVYSAAIHFQTT